MQRYKKVKRFRGLFACERDGEGRLEEARFRGAPGVKVWLNRGMPDGCCCGSSLDVDEGRTLCGAFVMRCWRRGSTKGAVGISAR
ncbi:hypothetical protein V6N13_048178 [Hibiscus sabdariffa]